ncbi:MAG: carboxypeptidase-like regulatory domain-containing protein [Myxococcota bacterium]
MSRFLMLVSAVALSGCAAKRAITGQILDRNGDPIDRVVVSIEPGNVELVTDSDGRFVINYLRKADGTRIYLSPRQAYRIEAFRTGYHVQAMDVDYHNGAMSLAPITLVEDIVKVQQSEADIDPEQFQDRTHSSGANYEGE